MAELFKLRDYEGLSSCTLAVPHCQHNHSAFSHIPPGLHTSARTECAFLNNYCADAGKQLVTIMLPLLLSPIILFLFGKGKERKAPFTRHMLVTFLQKRTYLKVLT